jgi:predicted dehydrogenase
MTDLHSPLKIGLVGLGKIAVDQHIPALRANPDWNLVAGCSPHNRPAGLPAYPTLEAMLAAHPDIDAVAICTPPQIRQAIARTAIAAGKHVFLEKPPAATLGEADAMRLHAERCGVSLLASWHSRFAPGVAKARDWVASHAIKSVRIIWKENVRQWHPGQKWIFEPGGMGVFDPGINALSIATTLLSDTIIVRDAELHVPVNCGAPIRAGLAMETSRGVPVQAEFDFLEEKTQIWSIHVEAEDGARLALHHGGATLEIDGRVVMESKEAEYPGLYVHFHDLIRRGASDADFSPLRIVADAFMVGKFVPAPAFEP